MHAQLQRYQNYLVNEQIPQHKKYLDEAQLENYRMTNIPADDYRTTADYEAVEDYLDMAYKLFNQRRQDPRCTQGQRCY